jgi:hypothetical protein
MKKKQKITFSELAKFIKGLPPQLIGEVFQALIETMGKKYGPDEFELDYDIIDKQLQRMLGYINENLPYDTIIEKLMDQGKIYKQVWETINKSIIKHIPTESGRLDVLRIMISNGQPYIETMRGPEEIVAPKDGGNRVAELPYAPNRKFQKFHYEQFAEIYSKTHSQSQAYEQLAKEYPSEIDSTKEASFLVSYRNYLKSKGTKKQK